MKVLEDYQNLELERSTVSDSVNRDANREARIEDLCELAFAGADKISIERQKNA